MPEQDAGVYIEEISAGSNPIVGVGTSTAVFIGNAVGSSNTNEPKLITSWNEFTESYQDADGKSFADEQYLPYAVYCFFNEGGTRCYVVNLDCPAKAIAYPEHSDSFSVRKKVDGTGADEALKAKVSDVNDEVYTFKLIVSEVESKSEVDNLDINFEELKVGQFSSEDGIKPSAESVELQKTTDGSPLPISSILTSDPLVFVCFHVFVNLMPRD
ncbi:MAG TPA: hypothetical protein EYP21_04925 [Syntrophaceae bacterium]|nr:hypothetical protein [Syntrophaceae bacterium]